LAVCWLFHEKTVQIDSPCLDCGEPIRIKIRDGIIESADPEGIIGHVSLPMMKWMEDLPSA
jgi:hypothetical protein